MKLKDMSFLFTAGVITILFVMVNMLSYLFIEKGLLLITIAIAFCFVAVKVLLGIL